MERASILVGHGPRDGLPVWTTDRCAMCLGCLHRCPKFAIQRGGATRKHGQYTNPHTRA